MMHLPGLNFPGLVLSEPDLTPAQARCAVAIAFLTAEHGSASFKRIARMLGVGVTTVYQYVAILERKIFVLREERDRGTIRLARPLRWQEGTGEDCQEMFKRLDRMKRKRGSRRAVIAHARKALRL